MTFCIYIYWISLGALIYSYLIYPFLLKILASNKKVNSEVLEFSSLPSLSIIIAAHNEEKVIAEKLESIFDCTYPAERMEVYVGSDASTDSTDRIISDFAKKHSSLKLIAFTERQGKVRTINKLSELSANTILIITDANVIFNRDTLVNLVKHFGNPKIGLVDTHMKHKGLKKEGISYQESFYIRSEVSIKNKEGLLWGSMMGPFGGCYALRKDCFVPVPETFLVDDFYINMNVLKKGKLAISDPSAIVYEDVSNDIKEELRRKVRIATGSFQNLLAFIPMLFKFNAISFCFFSHKVLRWMGPVLFILAYTSNILLMYKNGFYNFTFWVESFLLACVPLDYILQKTGLHIRILRLIRHFFFMNLAIFIGMIRATIGVDSSIWQPTRRHQ